MPNSNSCQNLIILLGKRSKIEINPAYEYKKIMHQLGGYNSLQGFFEVIFTVWGEQWTYMPLLKGNMSPEMLKYF